MKTSDCQVLDGLGQITLQYLGTESSVDATMSKPNGLRTEHMEYDDLKRELTLLSSGIRPHPKICVPLDSSHLALRTQSLGPKYLRDNLSDEQTSSHYLNFLPGDLPKITAHYLISFLGSDQPPTTVMTVEAPAWVTNSAPLLKLATDDGAIQHVLSSQTLPPSATVVTVTASFVIDELRVFLSNVYRIPMCLACQVTTSSVLEPTYKVTIQTNRNSAPLLTLFKDMLMLADRHYIIETTTLAISFRFWFRDTEVTSGCKERATATILLSKKSGRYRVQSNCLPALWLALDELTNRVKLHRVEGGGIELTYGDQLPLTDFYTVLDEHYNSRRAVRVAECDLNNCAYQYRIIQKRLLVRYKDSRPAMLGPLDLMLQQTHRKLLRCISCVDFAQRARRQSGHNLACATRLLLTLMKMRFDLSQEEHAVLCSHLNPSVIELNCSSTDEPGWEETTDIALGSLLKPSLSAQRIMLVRCKSGRPGVPSEEVQKRKAVSLLLPSFPATTERLKRHIAMLCDQLEQRSSFVMKIRGSQCD